MNDEDQIDQLMNEIEQLQQEIDSADVALEAQSKPGERGTRPKASVSSAAANGNGAGQKAKSAAPSQTSPGQAQGIKAAPATPKIAVTRESEPVSEESDEDFEDFGFGRGDASNSLEDTLVDLKEEPSSGKGALDIEMSSDEHEPESEYVEVEEEVEEEIDDHVSDETLEQTVRSSITSVARPADRQEPVRARPSAAPRSQVAARDASNSLGNPRPGNPRKEKAVPARAGLNRSSPAASVSRNQPLTPRYSEEVREFPEAHDDQREESAELENYRGEDDLHLEQDHGPDHEQDHAVVAETENQYEEEHHMKGERTTETSSSDEGCLTMTLRGNMTLKLQYDVDGQVVSVGFSDGALKVQLADGTEFKVPVRSRPALRRVV